MDYNCLLYTSRQELLFRSSLSDERKSVPYWSKLELLQLIFLTFLKNFRLSLIHISWAIVLKETGEAIGCIGYYTHETSNIPLGENDCEVGYWVGKPMQPIASPVSFNTIAHVVSLWKKMCIRDSYDAVINHSRL